MLKNTATSQSGLQAEILQVGLMKPSETRIRRALNGSEVICKQKIITLKINDREYIDGDIITVSFNGKTNTWF